MRNGAQSEASFLFLTELLLANIQLHDYRASIAFLPRDAN